MIYLSKNLAIKKIYIGLSRHQDWTEFKNGSSVIWFRGYLHNHTREQYFKKVFSLKEADVKNFLNSTDGHFCIIVIKKNYSFIAVDKIRSIPIIYSVKNNELIIADSAIGISKYLELNVKDIDLFSSRLFSLSGYSFNQDTIYKNIKQVNPGNFLLINKKDLSQKNYYMWMPWKADKGKNELKKLQLLNEKIIKKLIDSCKGKPIVIPLSGGYDSRFIAAGLKHFGYKDVTCVSYGIKGNKDAAVAKKVSKKLGYNWIFIKYSSKKFKQAFYSEDYRRYLKYCDSFTSIHFAGEYLMLRSLKDNNLVKPDSIIINGQSGDFISGNHMPERLLKSNCSKSQRLAFLTLHHVNKHYKHWKSLMNKTVYRNFSFYLNEVIKQIGGLPKKVDKDYAIAEYLEFINRQTKYVINGQRNYEYFGYDWRLPLWDDDYLEFWALTNYVHKKNQNLYIKSLRNSNWCDVWKNIDINPLVIAPKWIIPIRLIAKFLFWPIGKAEWHLFERKYLDYFITSTCCYGPWSYKDIITDKRGAHSPIGWLIEDYFKDKGINWKGEININHV